MPTTIERTRARSFRAALESLKEATEALIARMDFELVDDANLSDQETEKRSDELGSTDNLIEVFDDAIEVVATERNYYKEQLEIPVGDLETKVKEVRS
jgi:hypothetical protein